MPLLLWIYIVNRVASLVVFVQPVSFIIVEWKNLYPFSDKPTLNRHKQICGRHWRNPAPSWCPRNLTACLSCLWYEQQRVLWSCGLQQSAVALSPLPPRMGSPRENLYPELSSLFLHLCSPPSLTLGPPDRPVSTLFLRTILTCIHWDMRRVPQPWKPQFSLQVQFWPLKPFLGLRGWDQVSLQSCIFGKGLEHCLPPWFSPALDHHHSWCLPNNPSVPGVFPWTLCMGPLSLLRDPPGAATLHSGLWRMI